MIDFIKCRIEIIPDHPDKDIVQQINRILDSERDESDILDEDVIKNDVHALKLACHDTMYTKNAEAMFYEKSFTHIRSVCIRFENESDDGINYYIGITFPESALSILNVIVYSKFPSEYFANLLEISMRGFKTKDFLFLSVVLLRCEIDLMDIKQVFSVENGISLRKFIHDNASGHFKYALYELIGEHRSR